jgi:hypothetical protein
MTAQSKNNPGNAKNQPEPDPDKAERTIEEEDDELEIDPASVLESTSQAEDSGDIDKLIGRGLKLPPVQSDGLW